MLNESPQRREGLVGAVRVLADRAPVLVDLRAEQVPRLPPPIERAAYFVVAESLTNALKHAGPAQARVTLRYGTDGLDLDIGVAESVVVIGGSGTGKSVLLKCILGLLEPEAGSIKIDGEEVVGASTSDRDRINRKFGMLFQSAALFDSLPVWENVAFGLIQGRGLTRGEAKERAVTAFYERMVVAESQLGRVQEDLRLG